MTTKTNRKSRSGAKPNKSAFVRNLPQDMPAAEVIDKAKAEGLTLTPAYVYSIRTAARRRGGGAVAAVGRRASSGGGRVEDLLRAVAAEIGLSRAIGLLQAEQKRVRAFLGE